MSFNNISFFTSYGVSNQLPQSSKPEIVLCGRSNVGKSSLINKLANRKGLARTSAEPGKTATINFYDGTEFYLVDLPGYGYAKKSKGELDRFDALMNGYFSEDRDIALALSLIDVRHEPSKLDLMLIDFFIEVEMPFCIVFTKCDKLSNTALNSQLDVFRNTIPDFDDIHYVLSSSETGMGIEQIKEYITESTVE